MFTAYHPLKDRMFQIMDNEGKVINPEWQPKLSKDLLLKAYKFMLFARTADLMSVSYQRQGRMHTYPPNLGQEAIATAAGLLMKDEDWLVPAFREMGAWLLKGATLKDLFLIWGGNEAGALFSDAPNFMPISVPIASQIPHAVGIAYALKQKGKKGVVFAFVGDGGTSQGDFHEGLNFAGVWKVPLVLIVQNNQFAISVPVKKQTASKSLALKSLAYGIDGIQVDGNDFLAMYAALSKSARLTRAGKGPVLIEAVTYRRGAHTTSDDPTKYRTSAEEKEWEKRDPLKRLGDHLVARKWWDRGDEEGLVEQYTKKIDEQFSRYEKHPPYDLEDVFKYQFETLPDDLKKQQVEYEKFLNWRGSDQ